MKMFTSLFCAFCFVSAFSIVPETQASLLRYDFLFDPQGGSGTGHPALLNVNSYAVWTGYIEFDLDHSTALPSGGSGIQYEIDEGYGELFIDFGLYSFTVNSITVNVRNSTREVLYTGRLRDEILKLPVLADERYKYNEWLMDSFQLNLLAREGMLRSKGYLHSSGLNGGHWDWSAYGHVSISDGYPSPEELEDATLIPEPGSLETLILGLLIIYFMRPIASRNPETRSLRNRITDYRNKHGN